jgi:hypothetical protein
MSMYSLLILLRTDISGNINQKRVKGVKRKNATISRPFLYHKKTREQKKISCCLSNESIQYQERKNKYRGQYKYFRFLLDIFQSIKQNKIVLSSIYSFDFHYLN